MEVSTRPGALAWLWRSKYWLLAMLLVGGTILFVVVIFLDT